MIVKLLSRRNQSYHQLIRYILRNKEPNMDGHQVFTRNVRSKDIDGMVSEFLQNEEFRRVHRSNHIKMYHEYISLSANETVKIKDEVIKDLAEKYMELRGTDGMFVGSTHRDRDHVHVHFISSSLRFKTGEAFRMSKAGLQELKDEFQTYHKEKYPELTESFCNHGSGKRYVKDREFFAKTKQDRAKLKDEVQEKVQSIFKTSKSIEEFLEKLQMEGLHHYERRGVATGLVINDTKVRFTRLGIDGDALEVLQQGIGIEEKTKQTDINKQLNTPEMKTPDINVPSDMDLYNYNLPVDEFAAYSEEEQKQQAKADLDQWIEENLPAPEEHRENDELIQLQEHQDQLIEQIDRMKRRIESVDHDEYDR